MKLPARAIALAVALLGMMVVVSMAGLFGAVTVADVVTPGATSAGAAPGDAAPGDGSSIVTFAEDLLAGLGDQASSANIGSIVAWAAGEGSCARFNPLDTTEPEPGAQPFNTLPGGGHVWSYPSLSAGVQATVTTLTNGLYQPVLAVLHDSGGPMALEAAVRATPWGTLAFGSTAYRGAQCGAPV